jgi:hypothetical protein
MGIRDEERVRWPVVAWEGHIIWMRDVRLSADEDWIRSGAASAIASGVKLEVSENRY